MRVALIVNPRAGGGRARGVMEAALPILREHEEEAMLVAVANGSTYGGGMRVAPAARLDSGRLEVCIVHAVSKAGFIRAFPLVFSGRHVDHPRVTMLHGRRIAISADREFGLTGDGEVIGRLPASFEVMPAALPVVVGLPAGAD